MVSRFSQWALKYLGYKETKEDKNLKEDIMRKSLLIFLGKLNVLKVIIMPMSSPTSNAFYFKDNYTKKNLIIYANMIYTCHV